MALKADAFPATMLTSQNGIREFHSGPKYGRIEIGDHKLTKIDRGRDLATQEISENSIVTKAGKVSRPNPQQWSSGGAGGSAAFRTIPSSNRMTR
jgi:hypothetical protein